MVSATGPDQDHWLKGHLTADGFPVGDFDRSSSLPEHLANSILLLRENEHKMVQSRMQQYFSISFALASFLLSFFFRSFLWFNLAEGFLPSQPQFQERRRAQGL
jgi:hypothetical protein